jgi:hypothetical protein
LSENLMEEVDPIEYYGYRGANLNIMNCVKSYEEWSDKGGNS